MFRRAALLGAIAAAVLATNGSAAVLVDINADGTNRNATTAHFEKAMPLPTGSLSGETIVYFPNNNPGGGAYSQTQSSVTVAVSDITNDADGWFDSSNYLLEDGLYNRDGGGNPSATITLSGSGLGLQPNTNYELYLFAGRRQGHETTFTFDPSDPDDASGGMAVHTSAPVPSGDETLGTARYAFQSSSTAPTSLAIGWDGVQHSDGNQDAVFSGFALQPATTNTVAYWELDNGELTKDSVGNYDLTAAGSGGSFSESSLEADDPIPNPDRSPGFDGGAAGAQGNSGSLLSPGTDSGGLRLQTEAFDAFHLEDRSWTFEGYLQHDDAAPSGFGDIIGGTRDQNVGFGGGGFGGFSLRLTNDGLLDAFFAEGGGGATTFQVTSQDVVPVGSDVWNHFALTWEDGAGNNGTGFVQLFLNGALVGSGSAPSGFDAGTADAADANAFLIAGRAGAGNNNWDGRLDELRFVRGVLRPGSFLMAPEPGTMTIWGLGLTLAAVASRRRSRRTRR